MKKQYGISLYIRLSLLLCLQQCVAADRTPAPSFVDKVLNALRDDPMTAELKAGLGAAKEQGTAALEEILESIFLNYGRVKQNPHDPTNRHGQLSVIENNVMLLLKYVRDLEHISNISPGREVASPKTVTLYVVHDRFKYYLKQKKNRQSLQNRSNGTNEPFD